MLVLHNRLIGVPLMSLQTGAQVGTTTAAIIDPRRLNIVAFYCEGANIGFKPAILHTSDIREYSDIGIIINDSDDIMLPDDLVRLKEVLDFQFELVGKRVVEDTGRKLGKISDYATDIESFYIIKLHVQPSLFQSLGAAELLIDRSQIVNITDDKIVVRRPISKEEVPSAIHPHIDNPFRKPRPQAEATEIRNK